MQRHCIQLALTFILVLLSGSVWAGVKGICSNCHSMHNSQDLLPMRFNANATPLPQLLRGSCVECHTGTNSASNFDPATASSRIGGAYAPRVMGSGPPTYNWGGTGNTLAGGSFWWVFTADANGHNVIELSFPDDGPPPGYNKTTAWSGRLKCSGSNGCHGNPAVTDQILALESAHHTDTGAVPDGSTVGLSYRYLDGALGIEDADWEFTVTTTDHNQYSGEIRTLDTAAENLATISGQCARCHGMFHNTSNNLLPGSGISVASFQSPWLRHPTDYAMPLTGEYLGYGGASQLYDPKVPLGRIQTELGNADDMTTTNQRIILCLSCHRAHGSPYTAMLRWNFKAWPGADATLNNGCQICHTSKD